MMLLLLIYGLYQRKKMKGEEKRKDINPFIGTARHGSEA